MVGSNGPRKRLGFDLSKLFFGGGTGFVDKELTAPVLSEAEERKNGTFPPEPGTPSLDEMRSRVLKDIRAKIAEGQTTPDYSVYERMCETVLHSWQHLKLPFNFEKERDFKEDICGGSLPDEINFFEGNTVGIDTPVDPKFITTGSEHADTIELLGEKEPAMLASNVRSYAAAMIAATYGAETPPLHFVGGNPLKKRISHGIEHSGAEVNLMEYGEHLDNIFKDANDPNSNHRTKRLAKERPRVVDYHDESENSLEDVKSILRRAKDRKQPGRTYRIGFVSNVYHLDRLKALFESAKEQGEGAYNDIEVVIIPAEDAVLSLASPLERLGRQREYEKMYRKRSAFVRYLIEIKGLIDLLKGSYQGGRMSNPADSTVVKG